MVGKYFACAFVRAHAFIHALYITFSNTKYFYASQQAETQSCRINVKCRHSTGEFVLATQIAIAIWVYKAFPLGWLVQKHNSLGKTSRGKMTRGKICWLHIMPCKYPVHAVIFIHFWLRAVQINHVVGSNAKDVFFPRRCLTLMEV